MNNEIVRKSMIGLVALAASSASVQSFAETGWYIGGSASQAFVDERSLDEDDTGFKVFGGYKFNKYFGVEGSYYDFGEINDSADQLEIDGVSLAAVGSINVLPKLSLFGKIGVHDWDADTIGSIGNELSANSDTDAFYGFGVDYAVTNNWNIRGEIEQYQVDDVDVDVASVGVSYVF